MSKGKRQTRYTAEFRQKALERMKTAENISALARELGIRRKFLYEWLAQEGTAPVRRERSAEEDKEIERLKKKVAGLEQLAGRQAAELDFFKGALRRIKEVRQSSTNSGGTASSNKSGS